MEIKAFSEIAKLHGTAKTIECPPNALVAIARIDIAGTAGVARVDSEQEAGHRRSGPVHLVRIDGSWIPGSSTLDPGEQQLDYGEPVIRR